MVWRLIPEVWLQQNKFIEKPREFIQIYLNSSCFSGLIRPEKTAFSHDPRGRRSGFFILRISPLHLRRADFGAKGRVPCVYMTRLPVLRPVRIDDHRKPHAAADARARQAVLPAPAPELVQDGEGEPRPARAHGVSEWHSMGGESRPPSSSTIAASVASENFSDIGRPAAFGEVKRARHPAITPMARGLIARGIDDQPVDGRAGHYSCSGGARRPS